MTFIIKKKRFKSVVNQKDQVVQIYVDNILKFLLAKYSFFLFLDILISM